MPSKTKEQSYLEKQMVVVRAWNEQHGPGEKVMVVPMRQQSPVEGVTLTPALLNSVQTPVIKIRGEWGEKWFMVRQVLAVKVEGKSGS